MPHTPDRTTSAGRTQAPRSRGRTGRPTTAMRIGAAIVLALLTFGILLAGTGAAEAADSPGALDGQFAVAASRPGDHAVYALDLVIEGGGQVQAQGGGRSASSQGGGSIVVDANARWSVDRLADRVLPLRGTQQQLASYATSWTAGDFSWGWTMPSGWAGYGPWDPSGHGGDTQDAQRVQGEPWHVVHVDPQQRPVAVTRLEDGADASLPGARLADDLGAEVPPGVVTVPGTAALPCGIHSDLQDGPQPLGHVIHVSGSCPPPGTIFGLGVPAVHSDAYVAVGRDTVGGQQAIVYDLKDAPGAVRMWFRADVPYPVRILVPLLQGGGQASASSSGAYASGGMGGVGGQAGAGSYGDDDAAGSASASGGGAILLMYELTAFTPGSLPAVAASPVAPLAPRLITGPDATGVDHPFPLAAALVAARDDQEDHGVRDFLLEHPAAAVAQARFAHVDDAGRPEERWAFTLVGDGAALVVDATAGAPREAQQLVGQPIPGVAGLPGLPPAAVPDAVPGDDGVLVHSKPATGGQWPSPAQMPARLPSVADVLEAAAADGTAAAAPPSWAFELAGPGAWVAAGHAHATIERDEGTPGTPASPSQPSGNGTRVRLEYAFMGVDAAGGLLFVEEAPARYDVPDQEAERDPLAIGPGYDPSKAGGWTEPGAFRFASVGFWALPSARTTATVSGIATTIGFVAYLLWPSKFAIGLFSRIRPEQVLEQPVRRQVADLIEAEPGIHFQELARRLDIGRGALEHHVRKLVAGNVVVMQVSEGFTCFFPKGRVDRHLMAAAPVLKSEGARDVLESVLQEPGQAAQDVARRLGLTPSTVSYHVKRLLAAGLVTQERKGRALRLAATPLGIQAARAYAGLGATTGLPAAAPRPAGLDAAAAAT